MSIRRVAVLLVVVFSAMPLPAQYSVGSQNTLHYGWGNTNPSRTPFNQTKVNQIWATAFNNGGTTIGMMQEVMRHADMAKFTGCATGTCRVYASAFYGRGWYREQYAFFVTNPALLPNVTLVECSTTRATCSFSRPPASLLISPTGGSFAVVNLHAIWGRTKAGRQAEAAQAKAVRNAWQGRTPAVNRVLIGGDWNLTAAEVKTAFADCGTSTCVAPSGLTTLNPSGSLSSSYDHFYAIGFTAAATGVLTPAIPLGTWRTTVSDHIPVTATITY